MVAEVAHNFATTDQVAPTPPAVDSSAAWQKELQATLSPVDSAHSAWGSLIGANSSEAKTPPPGDNPGQPQDAKTQKANAEMLAMQSLGMGDQAFNGAQKDVKALTEQASQRGRELASAGTIAFHNIFDEVGKGTNAQAGFPNAGGRNSGLFRESNPSLDGAMASAMPLDTSRQNPALVFQPRAAAA